MRRCNAMSLRLKHCAKSRTLFGAHYPNFSNINCIGITNSGHKRKNAPKLFSGRFIKILNCFFLNWLRGQDTYHFVLPSQHFFRYQIDWQREPVTCSNYNSTAPSFFSTAEPKILRNKNVRFPAFSFSFRR